MTSDLPTNYESLADTVICLAEAGRSREAFDLIHFAMTQLQREALRAAHLVERHQRLADATETVDSIVKNAKMIARSAAFVAKIVSQQSCMTSPIYEPAQPENLSNREAVERFNPSLHAPAVELVNVVPFRR